MSEINEKALQDIGKEIKKRRQELSYSQRDTANMTGLTINTISSFENGKGTTLNNFLLICRALRIQPSEIFRKEMDLTPVYDLPPESKKKIEVTQRLDQLVYDSDFFETPRRVSEVIKELDADKSNSNKFSVYLSSYCKEGELEYTKEGTIKKYSKPSKV